MTRPRRPHTIAAGLAAAALGLAVLPACQSNNRRLNTYRIDATPVLMTVNESNDEVINRQVLVLDHHGRHLWSGMARWLLVDRRGRLHPYPSPY